MIKKNQEMEGGRLNKQIVLVPVLVREKPKDWFLGDDQNF